MKKKEKDITAVLTKLIVGVLKGTTLTKQECITLFKHIQTLEVS